MASGTQISHDGDRPLLAQHRLRLKVVEGIDVGLEQTIDGEQYSIGTSSQNDLVLSDPKVSRQHCVVFTNDQGYSLRDLKSTNGTFVDGTRIVEAEISAGVQLCVGDTTIQFLPRRKWIPIETSEDERFGGMLGRSMEMREIFGLFERVAPTRLAVLLRGETGTGKELAARALHEASRRADGPFVVVDCGAMAENLIESELFGHERGSFTGAEKLRKGAFESATDGTVFLDELGDLPLDLQPLLLRAVENREVKRIGSSQHFSVDVRVISATNRSLEKMVEDGLFRQDLYYRLTEVMVELPPLRQRVEDIELIAMQLITHETRYGSKVRSISQAAIELLQSRPWPGNVRELRNALKRTIALTSNYCLQPSDFVFETNIGIPDSLQFILPENFYSLKIDQARERWNEILDKQYLAGLLARSDGDEKKAAEIAGMHKKSLRRLMRRRGLKPDD